MSDRAFRWAWGQRRLVPTQRVLLLALADRADGAGDVPPVGFGRLAYEANVSPRHVSRLLRSLEDTSPPLVLRERREVENRKQDRQAVRLPNRYTLFLDHQLGPKYEPPPERDAELDRLDPKPSDEELAADPDPPAGASSAAQDAWARLRDATPPSLRVREADAEREFHRAVAGGVDPRVIVGGFHAHCRIWLEERTDPKYIPFLVNWIKGRRWEDNLDALRLKARKETGYDPRRD